MNFIFLSEEFYNVYSDCREIEQKRARPYVQVCIRIGANVYAVPMRSHIKHRYVLWTDEENGCGLDFSKTVVLRKRSYIDETKTPYIRPKEFDALRGKEQLVKQRLVQYIRAYKKAKQRLDVPRNKLLCQYSTLQYFEEYL